MRTASVMRTASPNKKTYGMQKSMPILKARILRLFLCSHKMLVPIQFPYVYPYDGKKDKRFDFL